MLLHTVFDPDRLREELLEQSCPQYSEITHEGVHIRVEFISGQRGRLISISSTDPQDYLHPELQPGTTIEFGSHII